MPVAMEGRKSLKKGWLMAVTVREPRLFHW